MAVQGSIGLEGGVSLRNVKRTGIIIKKLPQAC